MMPFNTCSFFLKAIVPLLSLLAGSNAAITSSIGQPSGTPTTKLHATGTLSVGQEPNSTVFSVTPSATTTLLPAVHWDHDPTNLTHVNPQPSGRLYYAEQPGAMDPTVGGQFAHVTTNFTYPAVILEHSSFIDHVTCGPSKAYPSLIELIISFSVLEAYQSAKSNWVLHADLVLVTYIAGCGVSDQDQRVFWKTSKLSFEDNNLNIHATSIEIPLQESITDMDLEWGEYEPAKDNSTFLIVTDQNGIVSTTCGAPNGQIIDGFPTAPCGPEFDKLLDDYLGYINGTSLESRSLDKRCKWYQIGCLAKKVVGAVENTLIKIDPHWDPSISKSIGFNLGPSGLVSTPFGQGRQLYRYSKNAKNYVAAYCVNCGVQGSVTLSGKASLTLLKGIQSAQVGMNGHVSAGLFFGIDAEGSYAPPKYSQTLGTVGIPGLSVPGIYSLGPMVSIAVDLSASVTAGGQALLGASLDWSAFAVTLDLVHGKNTKSSGLTPKLTTKFLAAGRIVATAGIDFPISVGIGIEIPVIKFKKALEIYDTPGLQATLTYNVGTSPVTGLTDSCNNGISSSMYFTNEVYISAFDIARYNIANYKSGAFARSCHKLRRNARGGLDTIEAPSRFPRRASSRYIAKRETTNTNSSISTIAPSGTTYSAIVDTDFSYELIASADGNLYLTTSDSPPLPNATTLYTVSENGTTALSDSLKRVLHYYPTVFSKYGVSRLRLSSITSLPKTASLAALVLISDIGGRFNGKFIFAVVTPEGTLGYPVLCTYRDAKQSSRVFMVRDLDTDLQVLEKEELRNTVTGGEVDRCVFLPLTLGIGAPAS